VVTSSSPALQLAMGSIAHTQLWISWNEKANIVTQGDGPGLSLIDLSDNSELSLSKLFIGWTFAEQPDGLHRFLYLESRPLFNDLTTLHNHTNKSLT
jgi:hypothetical protein